MTVKGFRFTGYGNVSSSSVLTLKTKSITYNLGDYYEIVIPIRIKEVIEVSYTGVHTAFPYIQIWSGTNPILSSYIEWGPSKVPVAEGVNKALFKLYNYYTSSYAVNTTQELSFSGIAISSSTYESRDLIYARLCFHFVTSAYYYELGVYDDKECTIPIYSTSGSIARNYNPDTIKYLILNDSMTRSGPWDYRFYQTRFRSGYYAGTYIPVSSYETVINNMVDGSYIKIMEMWELSNIASPFAPLKDITVFDMKDVPIITERTLSTDTSGSAGTVGNPTTDSTKLSSYISSGMANIGTKMNPSNTIPNRVIGDIGYEDYNWLKLPNNDILYLVNAIATVIVNMIADKFEKLFKTAFTEAADVWQTGAKNLIEARKTDLASWLGTNIIGELVDNLNINNLLETWAGQSTVLSDLYGLLTDSSTGLGAIDSDISDIYTLLTDASIGLNALYDTIITHDTDINNRLDTLEGKVDTILTILQDVNYGNQGIRTALDDNMTIIQPDIETIRDNSNEMKEIFVDRNTSKWDDYNRDVWASTSNAFGFTIDSYWIITPTIRSVLITIFDVTFSIILPNTGGTFNYNGISSIPDGSFDPIKHFSITIFDQTLGFYLLPWIPIPIPDFIADWPVSETSGWTIADGYPKPTTAFRIFSDILLILGLVLIALVLYNVLPEVAEQVLSILISLFTSYINGKKFKNINKKLNYIVGYIAETMLYLLDPSHNLKPSGLNSEDLYDGDYNP